MKFSTKYLNKISNVRKIELYDEYLIILSIDKDIAIYDLSGKNCYLKQQFNSSSMYLVKNKVISARNFVLDLSELKIHHLKELEGGYFSGINFQDLLLFNTFDTYKICTLSSEVLITHTCSISEDKSIVYLNHEGVIWLTESGIEYHQFGSGCLWEKNFVNLLGTNHPQLNGSIQFKDNNLFFVLNDHHESKSSFFVVDALTGQELYVEHGFGGLIKHFDNMLYRLYEKEVAVFSIKDFKWIYFNEQDVLVELNKTRKEFTSTGEIIGETIQDFNFSTSCYDVRNSELLFSQERGSQVGILDLASKSLLWNMDFKQNTESSLIKNVRLSNFFIYIIDNNNTLHIFEKE